MLRLLRWIIAFCTATAPIVLPSFATTVPAAHAALAAQVVGADYVPGVVLVGLPAASARGESMPLDRALAIVGATGAEPLFPESQQLAARGGGGDGRTQIFRLRLATGTDVLAAASALRAGGAIFAEPDYLAYAASAPLPRLDLFPDIASRTVMTPNDPLYRGQWGLAQIEAPSGWKVVTGTPGTTIAVIDSGIESSHSDLASRLWVNPGEIAGNSIDDDMNGFVDDVNGWNFVDRSKILTDDGQGTRVAGVAAAAGNNGVGIAGVCLNCRIMVLKVMKSSGGAAYSNIVAALNYAVAKGAHVINLSIGGYADSAALRAAVQNASARVVVVAAAGDGNTSNSFYPAAYPDVLGVAATTPADVRLAASNFGDWVSLAAPGLGITTTHRGNTYGTWGGTSAAAPFVAGMAALIRSQRPDWSSDRVRLQLVRTAKRLQTPQVGSGLLNAAAAVQNPQPLLSVRSSRLNGLVNGRVRPGAEAGFVVEITNDWADASGVAITLSANSPSVTVTQAQSQIGNLDFRQTRASASLTFTVAANAGAGRSLPFSLRMTANNGGYLRTVPLTITTRSIEEPVCGTIVDVNNLAKREMLWTSDKTYSINCNVGVASGYTLTIQPGTQVQLTGRYTFTVNGNLIADGTSSAPIRFGPADLRTPTVFSGRGTHSCAVGGDGVLYCNQTYDSFDRQTMVSDSVQSVAGGNDFKCLLTTSGAVKCWGSNSKGQLGNGTTVASNVPVNVVGLSSGVVAIAAGTSHACAVTVGGGMRCWGSNAKGALGNGTQVQSSVPVTVTGLNSPMASVVAGDDFTCALTRTGGAKCWGFGVYGILGNDSNSSSTTPVNVVGLGSGVAALGAGYFHVCALLIGGALRCWGDNTDGAVGDGTTTQRRVPVAVAGLDSGVASMHAGSGYTCAMMTDGAVRCWGTNYAGQLGQGSDGFGLKSLIPVTATVLTAKATAIGGDNSKTCVLSEAKSDVLTCWGFAMSAGRTFITGGWSGIVFSDSAVDAEASSSGSYLRGSVLRNAHIVNSEFGIRCSNAAPYLSNLTMIASSIQCSTPLTRTTWLMSSTIDGGVTMMGGNARVISNSIAQALYVQADLVVDRTSMSELTAWQNTVVQSSTVRSRGIYMNGQGTILNTAVDKGGIEARQAVTIVQTTVHGGGIFARSSAIIQGSVVSGGYFTVGVNSRVTGSKIQLAAGAAISAGANLTVTGNRIIGGNGVFASSGIVSGNLIANSSGDGLRVGEAIVVSNTVTGNRGNAVVFSRGLPLQFAGNNLEGNLGAYDLRVETPGTEVMTQRNWWGVTTTNAVRARIFDWLVDSTFAMAVFSPTLPAANRGAPIYLRWMSATPSPAGIGPVTLTVDFSRDLVMDPPPTLTVLGPVSVTAVVLSSVDGVRAVFVADVNSNWPRGVYTASVAGAVGTDGIEMAPSTVFTFAVGYPGSVTDQTPPALPVVAIGGASLTALGLRITATDTQSSITHFRYAIGTSTSGADAVNWTTVPVAVPVVGGRTITLTRSGLNLVRGVTYYVSAEACNAAGLWSRTGVSRPIIAGSAAALVRIDDADIDADIVMIAVTSTPVASPTAVVSPSPESTAALPGSEPTGTPSVTPTPGTPVAAGGWAPYVTANLDVRQARIAVQWVVSEAQTSVAAYRYALGSTPGGAEVADWRTVEIMAGRGAVGEFVIGSGEAPLTAGRSYYVSVQVMNEAGTWSPVAQAGPMALRQVHAPLVMQ